MPDTDNDEVRIRLEVRDSPTNEERGRCEGRGAP